jgi:hypothetical protein
MGDHEAVLSVSSDGESDGVSLRMMLLLCGESAPSWRTVEAELSETAGLTAF